MEMSWHMKNWQKVMEFCDPQTVTNAKFEQRDSHRKARNGHGKNVESLLQSLWGPLTNIMQGFGLVLSRFFQVLLFTSTPSVVDI